MPVRFLSIPCALLALAIAAPAQLPTGPGDWPGWRGPNRDNISRETGLLPSWPKGGPRLLWQTAGLGTGFSTPSVASGVIYLMGADDKDIEAVIALDAATGEKLWATPFGKTAGGHPGPRSTPTVDGDTLYVISSNGILLAADSRTGSPRWQKDFRGEFAGRAGGWAYTESPLIDGDLLICTPGADKAALVALQKQDGNVVWKADLSELNSDGGKKKRGYTTAGYASVVPANLAGRKQYVQFLSGGVVGVDAANGALLWHYDAPANKTANISTPVLTDDGVFAASAYNTGGGLARIVNKDDKIEAEEVYFLEQMQNHHGGMIFLNGHIFGTNGNSLLCVEAKSGKIAWQNRSVGKGSIAYADSHFYVRSEGGPVALVEASSTGYVEKGRFDQPDRSKQRAWAHPVVAGGCLLLRDQDILLCYDVKSR